MSANEMMNQPMTRTGIDADRVSVEMTHAQFGAIATALVFASVDPYLSPEVKAEYARVRELLINSPVVGLSDN